MFEFVQGKFKKQLYEPLDPQFNPSTTNYPII